MAIAQAAVNEKSEKEKKANIDDLFKTEDRCIEDNTPHTESTVLFKTENEE